MAFLYLLISVLRDRSFFVYSRSKMHCLDFKLSISCFMAVAFFFCALNWRTCPSFCLDSRNFTLYNPLKMCGIRACFVGCIVATTTKQTATTTTQRPTRTTTTIYLRMTVGQSIDFLFQSSDQLCVFLAFGFFHLSLQLASFLFNLFHCTNKTNKQTATTTTTKVRKRTTTTTTFTIIILPSFFN